ncbi:MAG: helix-turn-helix domain-containing protein [Candidatus Peribacteraceae bacterium]|nr:helix-turn-helix domain-containing protein [Candidatus Peribacteraceae bacterium]MDD5075319.1 helix-turn-helix domain-containing protein [Candidatus Peribacteraceae bacterium]
MATDHLHILRSVGLDEKEASLYLAGLELRSAPASDYAKATKMNRITAYNTLEGLARRGLVTVIKKASAKWYMPVPPEHLSIEARKNADALSRVLPELRSLQGKDHRRPVVRYFEGWEGIRRVYEDTFTAKSELLNFANSAVVRTYWPDYDEEYVGERVKQGIHLRGIAPDDEAGRKVHGEDKKRLREIRLVPAKDFDFTNEINIYDHKVAICSFGSPQNMFGVIIESKEVAETQRQIFEMAWRYSKHERKT